MSNFQIVTVDTLKWVQPEGVPFSEGRHEPATKQMVSFDWPPRMMELHDAKVMWTHEIRNTAMDQLKARRPHLYARYQLATLESYRDMQVFCARITGQQYCEIRGNDVGQAHAAIFGGASRVPSSADNSTPIPHVRGGLVYWYTQPLSKGGLETGYETICAITRPVDWAGDNTEAQVWIDFVEAKLDALVDQLKRLPENRQKQYFDVRRIPDRTNETSKLGYSPVDYA